MPEGNKHDDKVVLQVEMHCEGCKKKLRRALQCLPGFEKIELDMKEQKVIVKGKLDAMKVYETVKKKSGRRTVLLYPELKKVDEEQERQQQQKKEPLPPDPEITVLLKAFLHCATCAKQIKKNLEKMRGVSEVAIDLASGHVTVKGKNIDPQKLSVRVKKISGKHCEIVLTSLPLPPAEEPKKEEGAKEEPKQKEKPAEEKKEEEHAKEMKEEKKPAEQKKEDEKSAQKEGEKPIEEKKEEKAGKNEGDGETKEEKKEEEAAVAVMEDDGKVEVKKYQYVPSSNRTEYLYPPQLFSDENPNACCIM